MGIQVDIHCHLFNGEDLPVRGFISKTKLPDVPVADRFAQLMAGLVQGLAPGYDKDLARLDALLFPTPGLEEATAGMVQSREELERAVDRIMAELEMAEPGIAEELGAAIAADETRGEVGPEWIGDVRGLGRRLIRWATLFTRSRLDLHAEYTRTFGDELDLATPLLVDLGTGLGDRARTTVEQQMVLFEKLSRASMQGLLPGGRKVHVHPFIGFDPLAELHARRTGPVETPLAIVQRGILAYGFVGVKVYPPMGWRPSGNTPRPGRSADDAALLDEIVDELAAWCEEQDVPVTAHCNISNHAHPTFKGFGSPEEWVRVLEAHPGLRLNLGHFGGAAKTTPDDGWPWQIALATSQFEHLYADVGNHKVHDPQITTPYMAMLTRMFDDAQTATMASRVMYGSDWFMLATYPDNESFLPTYRELFTQHFGEEVAAGFMGGNALRFLGFDDPDSGSTRRLRARYDEHAPDATPAWLATAAP